jgi:hypothetical protein
VQVPLVLLSCRPMGRQERRSRSKTRARGKGRESAAYISMFLVFWPTIGFQVWDIASKTIDCVNAFYHYGFSCLHWCCWNRSAVSTPVVPVPEQGQAQPQISPPIRTPPRRLAASTPQATWRIYHSRRTPSNPLLSDVGFDARHIDSGVTCSTGPLPVPPSSHAAATAADPSGRTVCINRPISHCTAV